MYLHAKAKLSNHPCFNAVLTVILIIFLTPPLHEINFEFVFVVSPEEIIHYLIVRRCYYAYGDASTKYNAVLTNIFATAFSLEAVRRTNDQQKQCLRSNCNRNFCWPWQG